MMFPHTPPAEPPRVVVTGAGIITSLGSGWEQNAAGFRVGRKAAGPLSLFDVSRQRVKVAAQVELPTSLPASHLTPRQEMRLDRGGRMLLLAAYEAWLQSGWEPSDTLPFILGTTAGGMALGEEYYRQAVALPEKQHGQAARALYYQAHTQARSVADALGCSGPVRIISNACASGSDAIGHAWNCIRLGQADRVLAGGHEAHCQLVFSGFDSLQLMSPTVCRPFDAGRDGLLLGEGAGIVAMESLECARRRGANILGEVLGYGTMIDRHHLTQPQPQGDAVLVAMRQACQTAKINPQEVSYVNAHGTGTVLNDAAEALAISRWAGASAAKLPVSSTKGVIGHLLGAAGAVEAVACLMTLREQWLPPEPDFETPDPACTFSIVSAPQDARVDMVLSNSFGFGGINASLVFRRWA
jgi:3-oxoacyl-[acyl-carrier-protein] synthase II